MVAERTIAQVLSPLPGILAVLGEDFDQESILIPDLAKLKQSVRKFEKKRLVKGEVVAAGAINLERDGHWGQPLPEVGATVLIQWGKHCLKILPNDPDLPELGKMISQGKALYLYGMVEPWDTYVYGMPKAEVDLRASQESS